MSLTPDLNLSDESLEQIACLAEGEPLINAQEKHSTIYMLRTMQQNHIQLALMADNKANMLVAACFLAMSILGGRIVTTGFDPISGMIGLFALLAALSAVFAVIPRNTMQANLDQNFNILFFGHYSVLSKKEYLSEMNRVMQSDQLIYQSMLNDIYGMGTVLRKKYLFLRFSYLMFISGMLVPFTLILLQASGLDVFLF